MKEILETMPRIELALIIIGVFALMLGIIFAGTVLYLSISGFDIHHAVKPPVFPGVNFGNKQTNINNKYKIKL